MSGLPTSRHVLMLSTVMLYVLSDHVRAATFTDCRSRPVHQPRLDVLCDHAAIVPHPVGPPGRAARRWVYPVVLDIGGSGDAVLPPYG